MYVLIFYVMPNRVTLQERACFLIGLGNDCYEYDVSPFVKLIKNDTLATKSGNKSEVY